MIYNDTKRVAIIGMLSCMAIIVSYIEFLFPINIGIPGIKLGLANIVIIIALYNYKLYWSFLINIIRIFIIGMLFGNLFSIIFSLTGGIISMLIMYFAKKIKSLTIVGVSILGGVFHNISQLVIAGLIMNLPEIIYYIPVLVISGAITGTIIGVLGNIINGRIFKNIRYTK